MVLVNFYLAYRLNRDEGIIVVLQERVTKLELKVTTSLTEDYKN